MHLPARSVAVNILGEGGVQGSTGLFCSLGIVQIEFICIKSFPCYLLSRRAGQRVEITSCFLLQQNLTLVGWPWQLGKQEMVKPRHDLTHEMSCAILMCMQRNLLERGWVWRSTWNKGPPQNAQSSKQWCLSLGNLPHFSEHLHGTPENAESPPSHSIKALQLQATFRTLLLV